MDMENELRQLKQRVDDLEGTVNTLAGQMRRVHPELVELKAETTRRFDAADHQMGRIVQRLDTMNTQVWSLRDDLPMLLRQALDPIGRKPGGNGG